MAKSVALETNFETIIGGMTLGNFTLLSLSCLMDAQEHV